MPPLVRLTLLAAAVVAIGCRSGGKPLVTARHAVDADVAVSQVVYNEAPDTAEPASDAPAETDNEAATATDPGAEPELLPTPGPGDEALPGPNGKPPAPPTLAELVDSVRLHFPVIQEAIAARTIASGETLAAWGAFDHKLESFSESQPLGFYENYRQNVGVKRDTYWGGQTFAGYRIGRGVFEPWYLERETNKGGEFKAGFIAPLAKDRVIDANRAELWRAQLERQRVEPEIRALVIDSTRAGTVAYWQWVAAAARFRISERLLRLGVDRIDFLERQVEEGEKAEIDLVDNRRIIVSRQAKLTDARRKLQQSALKLSLYLRDPVGDPVVLPIEAATLAFPDAATPAEWGAGADVATAIANRPELAQLRLVERQLTVDLNQARNETIPDLDAGLLVSQDVGEPTSSKRDKSELELEASLLLSVPLERRKALGKERQVRGKLAQVNAKTRYAADKIAAETRSAHAALVAAAARVAQTSEGVELAGRMRTAERRLYELGQSTLFNLNLREQQEAEAALDQVDAQFDYHAALADYAASLGLESSETLQPAEPPAP